MKNRFGLFLVLTILYALLIFYLSSSSDLGDPRAIFPSLNLRSILESMEKSNLKFLLYPLFIFSKYPDKVMHIILYAGLGLLLYLTLKNSSNNIMRNYAFVFAVIIGALYGASDEFHQSFVPGRAASTWDLLADTTGATIVQAVIFMKKRLFKRYERKIQK